MNFLKHIKTLSKTFVKGTFENLRFNKDKILREYILKERISNVIVSLTTYHPRLQFFEFSILSILNGSILPDKILIYVPKGFLSLVMNNDKSFLKNELNKGFIHIIEMDVDLKCHSKYYYSFENYGEENDIILIDDDVVYYKNWLEDIIKDAHSETNYDIFAFKCVAVKINEETIEPYSEWTHCSKDLICKNGLLYTEGVGGVFYRRNKLKHEVLNKDKFMKLAPNADDVWLWFCTHYNSLKIKFIIPSNGQKLLYVIPNSQVVNLWAENTFNNRNDQYIRNCYKYFKEDLNFDIVNNFQFLEKKIH